MECTGCHRTGFTEEELLEHQQLAADEHKPLDRRGQLEHAKFDDCEGEGLVIASEDPRVAQLEAEIKRVTAVVARLEATELENAERKAIEGGADEQARARR